MKERIILEPDEKDRILVRDGKKFRMLKETIENGHVKEVIFEEINEDEYENQLDKISSYLINKSNLDAKTIIKDILRKESSESLNKLEREINNKSPPVEVVPGCLSLKVGKRIISIVD